MNRIIDADGGFICYPDLCSAVAERISLEMTDPEVQVLRNLRRMTFAQLEFFDPMYPIPGYIAADADPDEDGLADECSAARNKPRAPKRYH